MASLPSKERANCAIRIHTNWTNTVQQVHTLTLDDLTNGAKRDLLRAAFTAPERLRPTKTRQVLTEEAAERFASLAQRLREWGHGRCGCRQWTVDGAAVRVSMVCFDAAKGGPVRLDGAEAGEVFADLTARGRGTDLTKAVTLPANSQKIFQGMKVVGSFVVSPKTARAWLVLPQNRTVAGTRKS